jgi:AcrR family transcriptional regulator
MVKPQASAKETTKQKILHTAMGLYAHGGINTVTLRQISVAAGCANTAAVHYHFSDRSGLLLAIVGFLGEKIWLPGYEGLQNTVNKGGSLRAIIQAGLRPYKQAVLDFPWGGDAQSFLFHLGDSGDEKALMAFEATRRRHDVLYKKSVRAALPNLSKAVFEQRWQFMMTEAIAGQFVRAKLLHTGIEASGKWSPQQERTYLKRYLDYVVGGLKAEVTD